MTKFDNVYKSQNNNLVTLWQCVQFSMKCSVELDTRFLMYSLNWHGCCTHNFIMVLKLKLENTQSKFICFFFKDINECATYQGGCEYKCKNTQGSYTCSCPSGFSLYSHTACQGNLLIWSLLIHTITYIHADINECSTNNGGCNQDCHNTPGSFYCSCNTGYSLNSNGYSCNGKDRHHNCCHFFK